MVRQPHGVFMVSTSGGALSARPSSLALPEALAAASRTVDDALDRILPRPHGLHARVQEAMRYAVFAGGKRLRPFLVLNAARLFDVDPGHAARAAAAIEVLHTYSLVHDDLPAWTMTTCAAAAPRPISPSTRMTAVLAGDALLTIAFEILAHPNTTNPPRVRSDLVLRLAEASGSNGMIGGQMIDMQAAQTGSARTRSFSCSA